MENYDYGKLASELRVKSSNEFVEFFSKVFSGKEISSMPKHEVWQHLVSKLPLLRGAKCLEGRGAEVCQTIQNKVKEYDSHKADEVSKTKQDIKEKFGEELSKFTILETQKLNTQLDRLNTLKSRIDQSANNLSQTKPRIDNLKLIEKAVNIAYPDKTDKDILLENAK